jgi:histidyl-tRNA synthetase
VLRALDKLAKIGREAVIDELQKQGVAGGTGLTLEQASQVLDFAENGKGGSAVLDRAEASLGSSPAVSQGIGNLRTVLQLLKAAGVPEDRVMIDLGLARGLDYYTGIVFETTVKGWEKFGSIASGGRYDNLASLFTPRRLPGVGASIGLDRLLALLDEAGTLKSGTTTAPVLVANFPGTDPIVPFTMAARLRAVGIGTEVYPDPIPIGKQMGYGSSRGHKLAVIVGPDEMAARVFNLRNLSNRQEDKGLAWSVLEDSVESALQILKQEGTGS